jgi:hypothetical protein
VCIAEVIRRSPDVLLALDWVLWDGDDGHQAANQALLESIPAVKVSSFGLHPTSSGATSATLRQLLVSMTSLKSLTLWGQFEPVGLAPTGGKLSALKSLCLSDYDWKHTISNVSETWDFSRLEDLSIYSSLWI